MLALLPLDRVLFTVLRCFGCESEFVYLKVDLWFLHYLVALFNVNNGFDVDQDSSITVAFDDIPEDGLNSPLRLEKVANEVLV